MNVKDNIGTDYKLQKIGNDYILPKEQIPENIKYIDITNEYFEARCGENGYYVIADCESKGSHLCRFTDKPDYEIILKQNLMPIFGVKNSNICAVGIIKGLRQNFYVVVGASNKKFYLKLRFEFTSKGAYDDIRFSLTELNHKADYCDMAAVYREYQLKEGNCRTLKEKILNNEYLKYAVEAPEIRIRLGWKPVPPEIIEQTEKNEPEVYVACTFDRVKEFIDELKKQGVDKAEICLVGWNKSGHDGRYPQLFPVEEKMGGEKKLRSLIKYAQENGYQIVCHTNSTDCYSIANNFSNDIVIKDEDMVLKSNEMMWSGGKMYYLCPIKAVEFAREDLAKVAGLGFRGLHYIDVMTVASLRECYDENHPCNKSEALECYEKIMSMCHTYFGGFASEGAFDFASKYLDYALYVAWSDYDNVFFDEEIPLYELVYHGIVLYNPSTTTVNMTIKGKESMTKLREYGGRPTFYIYSKFIQGSDIDNWLGDTDLTIMTDEQLKYSVSKIKEAYDLYKKDHIKQYEFMLRHEKIDDNTYKVCYSNGYEDIIQHVLLP